MKLIDLQILPSSRNLKKTIPEVLWYTPHIPMQYSGVAICKMSLILQFSRVIVGHKSANNAANQRQMT